MEASDSDTRDRTAAAAAAAVATVVETDDTLDPDIDVAAEQIVNEFAQHHSLPPNAAIYENDEVMNDPKDEEDEVGVMSHSLAAGGFEELIVAFDEEEEEEEEVEEEVIDESYEEEEFTEEELLDPNVVEEVDPTEQSIGGGAQKPTDDDDDDDDQEEMDVSPPHNQVSNDPTTTTAAAAAVAVTTDAGSTMERQLVPPSVVHVIPPEEGPMEVRPDAGHPEATPIPIEEMEDSASAALNTAPSLVSGGGGGGGGNSTLNKVVSAAAAAASTDHVPMELSPTSQPSYVSSSDDAALHFQASDMSLLRGDALLGEMSELSTATPSVATAAGSASGGGMVNKSERSTTSSVLSIKSIKSLLSSKSNKSNTAAPPASAAVPSHHQQQLQQQQQQQQQLDPLPLSTEHSTTKSQSSERTQTAASVATVPVSNVQQRYVPGRDPAGTAAGASPLVVMHEGDPSTSEVMEEEYTEEYEEEEVFDAVVEETTLPTVTATATKPVVPIMAAQKGPSAVKPTPVVPPTIVPTAMAASALGHETDVEMGHVPPPPPRKTTVTEVPKAVVPLAKQESATEQTAPKVAPNADTKPASATTPTAEPTTEPSRRRQYLAALICFLVLLLVVILSVVLTRDDNNQSRDIPIAPSPTAVVPPPVQPVASPVPLAWVESIPAVGGPTESGFASAISLDENIWAVGAPLYNESGYGAVFTTLRSDAGDWDFLPLLLGEQAGDDFGAAVDVQGGRLVVGAPMRPIVDTTTPAGAAYVYSYSPTVGAWELQGSALRSGEGILEANGEFGAAVALGLAASPRVAIGAPRSNPNAETLEAGRVYTFEAVDTEWNALETTPLFGKAASDWFGYSVDLSDDGSRLLVGAPGSAAESTGYIQIYEWTETQWSLRFEDVGSVGEAFGSSVVSLSETGDLVAAGGPGYSQGSGRVVVYQRQESGEYIQLGQPIVGASGDRIGSAGSLTGGTHDEGTVLVTSTATGSVKTYTLNPTDSTWNERFEILQFDAGGGEVSVKYSEETGLLVGNLNTEQVFLFDDQPGVIVTSAPITTPVATSAPVVDGSAVVSPPNSTQAPVGSSTINATDSPVAENSTITATVAPTETWILTGSSFTPNTDGSAFGTSVSLAPSTMAVGAPVTLQNGAVFLYQNNVGTWETTASGQLFGTEPSGLFGASVDVVDGFVVVGAPAMAAAGTTTPAGAVLAYSLASGQWSPVGEALRGDAGVYAAGEQFGASVSTANAVRRVVVGAPGSSLDIIAARGRVYVYEYNDGTSSWAMMLNASGVAANYALGTSVDMSQDGTQFVVGAPGGGYAELYEYTGSSWISAYVVQDATGFGSAVAILGSYTFAVGHPGANSGQGRVTIFQGSAGVFTQLGPAIDGEAGDQLGDTGTISGGNDAALVSVVLGTANGTIKRFDYDASSNTWLQRGDTVYTAFGSSLNAVAASSRTLVVGGPLAAEIYELQ